MKITLYNVFSYIRKKIIDSRCDISCKFEKREKIRVKLKFIKLCTYSLEIAFIGVDLWDLSILLHSLFKWLVYQISNFKSLHSHYTRSFYPARIKLLYIFNCFYLQSNFLEKRMTVKHTLRYLWFMIYLGFIKKLWYFILRRLKIINVYNFLKFFLEQWKKSEFIKVKNLFNNA